MNDIKPVDSLKIIETVDLNSITEQINKISTFQRLVNQVLVENHDYGVIPGTSKPTLLKPGAEKIQMLLGVSSEYDIIEHIQDFEKGLFSFTVKCKIFKNGFKITEGLGHCNSLEPKFHKKRNGELQNANEKVNTILKMAKKRAQIDATLTLASLSQIFTQDVEDFSDFEGDYRNQNNNNKQHKKSVDISNMNVEEAAQIKLMFGKHKGKTLREVYISDKNYLEWYIQKGEKADIRKAIELMFKAVEHKEKSV